MEIQLAEFKKILLEGSADDRNNSVIIVGPTEEKFVINKCLAKLSSLEMEKLVTATNSSKNGREVKIPEIIPKHFKAIVEYAIMEINWEFTNLEDTCCIIEAAARFGLGNFIKNICQTVFSEAQTNPNAFDEEEICRAMMLFQEFDFTNRALQDKALEYAVQHASSIFQGDQFLKLPFDDFAEIIIQDKLVIDSEIEVLNAVIRWGMNALKSENKMCSPESLRSVLGPAINWIRFPNMTEREFRDYIIPLEIFTDEQVNGMIDWYKNHDSVCPFSKQPREYRKTKDLQVAAKDPERTEEFLQKYKLDNLLAKFNMDVQTQNLEPKIRNLTNRNAELEDTVKRLELLLQKNQLHWKNVIEADRFCGKLEQIRKCLRSEPNQDYEHQMQIAAEKICKSEECNDFLVKNEEIDGEIDLDLLKSFNEENGKKITEMQKAMKFYRGETLLWKVFQEETESSVRGIEQKFDSTQARSCAIIFKNNTNETCGNFQSCETDKVSRAFPSEIQPFSTHIYRLTGRGNMRSVLSYDVGSTRVFIRCYIFEPYDSDSTSDPDDDFQVHNEFWIALDPVTCSMSISGWRAYDWANTSTKINASCKFPGRRGNYIKLGNLCLLADIVKTGHKSILRVLLTSV